MRLLRLRSINPDALLCFVFFEGAVVLAVLLAFAEQVSWWGVVVLPATVALMVKLNDVVAGSLIRARGVPRAVGRVKVAMGVRRPAMSPAPRTPHADAAPDAGPRSASAASRQSASRRYR